MKIQQLLYFVKSFEAGSFLRASESLFISQQALSRSLACLEQELGGPLFFRSCQGISPTPLGQELYRSGLPVIRSMEELDRHMEEFVRENQGELRIGVTAGSRYFNAKSVWNDFSASHPGVTFLAEEYSYQQGMELFENRELDVLIFSDFKAGNGCRQYILKTLDRVLLLPADHPLAQREAVSLNELDGYRLVLSINSYAYRRFLSLCHSCSCSPAEIFRVSDTLYMYETCNIDRCIGITIDRYFTDIFLSQFPGLRTVPFDGRIFPYQISLLVRKAHPRQRLIASLAAYLREYLRNR